MTKPCTFPGCKAKALGKGLCAKHYMRLRRHAMAIRARSTRADGGMATPQRAR